MSACWKWYIRLSASAAAAGKQELLLSWDEAIVSATFTHGGGNVMQLSATKEWSIRPLQFASRSVQRRSVTHAGLVCNDTHNQSLLPQAIFVSDHLLPSTVFATVQAKLPPDVYAKRMPKGLEQHSGALHHYSCLAFDPGTIVAPLASHADARRSALASGRRRHG